MPGAATASGSDAASAQTRSRLSGLDSASECIRRELISVSDLCAAADEVQDLLDEITLLGEACSSSELELGRPGSRLTQGTWDSHQAQVVPIVIAPSTRAGVLCWPRRLLMPLPLTELSLMLCTALALLCVAVSGDPLRLPAAAHTRLALACCVCSLLSTLVVLACQLTNLQLLLPLNPARMHRCILALVCVAETAAAIFFSHQSVLYDQHRPPVTERARIATTLAAVFCWLGAGCALLAALMPRCMPSSGPALLSAPATGSSLASAGADWDYRHPEPDADPEPPPERTHNPYIEWHLRNGNFHLLPEAVRCQLTTVT